MLSARKLGQIWQLAFLGQQMVMFIKKLHEFFLANCTLVMHIQLAHKLPYPLLLIDQCE